MTQPTVPIALNMDILLSILSRSPPKTATSMMATCHFLYHEGAKYIFQQHISLAGSEREVLSLLCFIQAEDLSRCPYVRDLSIPISITSEAIATALSVVVPRMSNIAVLHLNGEHPFGTFPYLLPVFASIRSLKTLTLSEAGIGSSSRRKYPVQLLLKLQKIHPPITSITAIHLYPPEMKCAFWDETNVGIEAVMSSPIIYPNVRNLVLEGHGFVPCLPPYIRAFPNLVHLKVEGNCSFLEDVPQMQLPQNQQTNAMLQGLAGQPLRWRHIQTFSGTLPNLRVLRIPFPIPRLYFTKFEFGTIWAFRAPIRMTEVLASARPVHLSISFEDRPFSVSICPEFLAALASEGASRLQSLTVTIELMAADVDSGFDVRVFWTTIENIFSRLPLSDLNIVMRDISLRPSASENAALPSSDGMDQRVSQGEHRTPFTLAECTLEAFDVRAFVSRLSAFIPTLHNAVVSVSRPRRWVGGMRTARLGKKNEHSDMHANAGNHVLYEEGPDTVQGNENTGSHEPSGGIETEVTADEAEVGAVVPVELHNKPSQRTCGIIRKVANGGPSSGKHSFAGGRRGKRELRMVVDLVHYKFVVSTFRSRHHSSTRASARPRVMFALVVDAPVSARLFLPSSAFIVIRPAVGSPETAIGAEDLVFPSTIPISRTTTIQDISLSIRARIDSLFEQIDIPAAREAVELVDGNDHLLDERGEVDRHSGKTFAQGMRAVVVERLRRAAQSGSFAGAWICVRASAITTWSWQGKLGLPREKKLTAY
ncbi:hypothetical protein V8D89_002892 [Ganoderma adspersum]